MKMFKHNLLDDLQSSGLEALELRIAEWGPLRVRELVAIFQGLGQEPLPSGRRRVIGQAPSKDCRGGYKL